MTGIDKERGVRISKADSNKIIDNQEKIIDNQEKALGNQEKIISVLRLLVRQKLSNKQEILMDEVTRRGRLHTTQVMNFLGISRTHALTVMKKVGGLIGYKFVKGDAAHKRPSLLIYEEAKILIAEIEKMEKICSGKEKVTFHDILIDTGKSLEEVKQLAELFVEKRREWKLMENHIILSKNHKVKTGVNS